MSWCGDESAPLLYPWKSPCVLEYASAFVMLFTTSIVYAVQRSRLNKLRKEVVPGTVFKLGMDGSEAVCAALSAIVFCLHACHFLAGVISEPDNYHHLGLHGAVFLSWLLVFCLNWSSSSIHATLDYRPAYVAGMLVYGCLIYVYTLSYIVADYRPGTYLKLELWTSVLQFATTVVLVMLEFKRHSAKQSPDGYNALPDVEQGSDSKVPRTWVLLFFNACKFVWPESFALKGRVVACIILLLLTRVVNLSVPIISKNMTNQYVAVTDTTATGKTVPFKDVVLPWTVAYLIAIFFQGGMGGGVVGLLNNLRQYLWIPVSQDAFFRINRTAFSHVLELDLEFHTHKKTGEVTKVVDRGTLAIQNVLSTLVFSIGPQLIDVLTAATYLATVLNPLIALVVFVTVGAYMPLTVIVTEWRGKIRRDMNVAENKRSARITDALLNYETIKYHNAEDFETEQYVENVKEYQRAEFRFNSSLNSLNVLQSVVMFCGISAGLLLLCAELGRGEATVGDTVLFLGMMAQLYAPLNFFGTYYRIIQQYFIDMENLFDLMDKVPCVKDKAGAVPLRLTQGEVEFDKVWFGYDATRSVVRDLSFVAPGGKTVAFVGATGSGKSTLTRLIFRFYDVKSGLIRIDGQNITDVTLSSLHAAIGLVPQDCMLFNDTIRHNIRYGRLTATEEEVVAAADAACIHNTITTQFPKGYDTIVGERGMRLSGGEKQRVAFARALLKNAPILVLDEATSALDSITEKKIVSALSSFRQDRTTLIVAHRLSTIMDADLICVMKDGEIVERGKHSELLEAAGLYFQMWSKQQSQVDEGESSLANGTTHP